MRLFLNGTVSWNMVILNYLGTMKSKKYLYTNVLKYSGQNSLTDYFADYIIKVHLEMLCQGMLYDSINENEERVSIN